VGPPELRVLGIPGSLRADSYNAALIRAAQDVAPEGMLIQPYSLEGIPMYNQDVDAQGDPPAVADFKQAIRDADALLISTPEYNHAVPGVLKNALDWASRPPRESVLDVKPVALMGAATGIGGTAQAQADVRRSLAFPGAQTMPEPELYVARARTKFDDEGRLMDAETRAGLEALLASLGVWTRDIQALLQTA